MLMPEILVVFKTAHWFKFVQEKKEKVFLCAAFVEF